MKDKIFFTICFGLIFGVFLRTYIYVSLFELCILLILSFCVWLFFTFISRDRWGKILGIFAVFILLGMMRFSFSDVKNQNPLYSYLGKKIEITGIVVEDPTMGENNQKLTLKTEKTKILISTDFETEYKYGDEVKFVGKLQKPENFVTDYGKEFDYVNYLRKDGILYVMNFAKGEILSQDNGNFFQKYLFIIKNKFLEKINDSVSTPESLLMGGLILGEKAAFSQEIRQNFINTGTIHIIALSGYNVTIVAEWIIKIFSFLPINLGIYLGIFSIVLFIMMTGASTTAIRAGVMASLALFARATGRNYDVARSLLLAGVVMILFNPLILVYDVSFQLSFIATVAVIFLTPKIEKYFTWVTKKFGLRDIISVTCAAYVFVLPFILYKMGTLSLVALPANVLILPFIPLTMVLGFLTGFFGLISNILAFPFGILSYVFLHYELVVINIFSSLPFASFAMPNFPLILMMLIYAYFIYRLFGRGIKDYFH